MRKADVTPLYNLHITVKIKSGYFQVPVQIYPLEQAVQYNYRLCKANQDADSTPHAPPLQIIDVLQFNFT